jgi:hypothetical protein
MNLAYPVTVAVPSLPVLHVHLARVSGKEETWLNAERAGEATRLLAALLHGSGIEAAALPVSVHDRLLAAIFRTEVGDTALCRAICAECEAPFEFSLPLESLIAAQDAAAADVGPLAEDGCWQFDGIAVRPPTLDDARSRDPAALLRAVCHPEPAKAQTAAVAAFLERAAPILSMDLDTECPECGAAQLVGFDLPRFLVRALAAERPFMMREVHLIAARYGWSLTEILAMPRDDRRAFATLIESERSAALRRSNAA